MKIELVLKDYGLDTKIELQTGIKEIHIKGGGLTLHNEYFEKGPKHGLGFFQCSLSKIIELRIYDDNVKGKHI